MKREPALDAGQPAQPTPPAPPAPPESAGLQGRLTYEELAASLERYLERWDGRRALWVFGYGSLIWKPELSFDRREPARVHGYHRRLCLWSRINRGTPDCPGPGRGPGPRRLVQRRRPIACRRPRCATSSRSCGSAK